MHFLEEGSQVTCLTKDENLGMYVLLKQQAEVEHSHGSCKGIPGGRWSKSFTLGGLSSQNFERLIYVVECCSMNLFQASHSDIIM